VAFRWFWYGAAAHSIAVSRNFSAGTVISDLQALHLDVVTAEESCDVVEVPSNAYAQGRLRVSSAM
jgi:hypothetical protein